MNRIYHIIWSKIKQQWVVVAETSRTLHSSSSRRRGALKLLAFSLLLGVMSGAQALPQGGQVMDGSADITQVNTTTTIEQTSPTVLINWQSFNLGTHDLVIFKQPDASAIAINTVVGSAQASQIAGVLSAKGQVFLVNPNGVQFGQGSIVNVRGLMVSTLDMQSATGSTYRFAGNGTGSIINQGNIQASQGGYVALIANQVSNQGRIQTLRGTTALIGGNDVTVTFPVLSPASIQINASTLNNLAENTATGTIQANGGVVIMSAGAADSTLASAVNTSGIIEAQTLRSIEGHPFLGPLNAYTVSIVDQDAGQIYFRVGGPNGFAHVGGTVDISDQFNQGYAAVMQGDKKTYIGYNGTVKIISQEINSDEATVALTVVSKDFVLSPRPELYFPNGPVYEKKYINWGCYQDGYCYYSSKPKWALDPASSIDSEYSPRSSSSITVSGLSIGGVILDNPQYPFFSPWKTPETVIGRGENMPGAASTAHKIRSHSIQ